LNFGERQPSKDRLRGVLRGPDGAVKQELDADRPPIGPQPSANGKLNVVEVVEQLLFAALRQRFRDRAFRAEVVRAATSEPGTETQIALYLCLESSHLLAVCAALKRAREAQEALARAVASREVVKVH
jgi:hypothetical protein